MRKPAPVCRPGVAGSAEGATLPLRTLVPAATQSHSPATQDPEKPGPGPPPCSTGERVAVTGPGGPVSGRRRQLSSGDRAPSTSSTGPFTAGSVSQVQRRRGWGEGRYESWLQVGEGGRPAGQSQDKGPLLGTQPLGSARLHVAELGRVSLHGGPQARKGDFSLNPESPQKLKLSPGLSFTKDKAM